MNNFMLKILCFCLAVCLACGTTVIAFAETGTTAVHGEVDADENGKLTAADARSVARAALGLDKSVTIGNADCNADGKLTPADAKILLRASAGIKPLSELDFSDPLDMSGMGPYDKAFAVNGKSYSVTEYNYYYTSFYVSYAQQSYYYDQYYGQGYGAALTGFDYSVSPAEQYLPTAPDTKPITFAEYFHDLTVSTMEQYSYYAKQATDLGLTFNEDDIQLIEQTDEQLFAAAEQYGMSTDDLLAEQYGPGMNFYIFRNAVNEQLLAQKYQEYISAEQSDSITDEDLEKAYQENSTAYDSVSLRAFRLAIGKAEDDASNEQLQQEKAADFVNKVTDEASFIKLAAELDPVNFAKPANSEIANTDYDTIENAVGEDAAKWAFDSARKVGDKQVFSTGSYIYVLFIVKPAARNEEKLPSVRHILVTFSEPEEGEEGVTNAAGELLPTKQEAYALAEKYLAEYKRGKKTEESFAAIAEKYSEDTASLASGGQGNEGGLYADMQRGAFVREFEDWAYDEQRKPGDTGIIETTYGYHIMYFCGTAEEPQWKTVIREALAREKTENYMDALSEKYAGTADFDSESKNAVYKFALACVEGYI